MIVKNYDPDRDAIRIHCPQCGTEFEKTVGNADMTFLEEFGAFNNPSFVCPECDALTFINVNIPEFEEMEMVEAALDMPAEEITARQNIRNMMWRKRPDLRGKDRAAEVRNWNNRNKNKINNTKASIEEIRERRGRRPDVIPGPPVNPGNPRTPTPPPVIDPATRPNIPGRPEFPGNSGNAPGNNSGGNSGRGNQ